MARNPKARTYETTSRLRAGLKAQALLMGWTPIDAIGVYDTGEGVVIMDREGGRHAYSGRMEAGTAEPATEHLPKPKSTKEPKARKVYAPKSWNPASWNRNRETLIAKRYSKEQAVALLSEALERQPDPTNELRLKHFRAVCDALPDGPDWADLLPVGDLPEESSDEG